MSYRRSIQISLFALFVSACAHGAGSQPVRPVQYAGAEEGRQIEGRSLTSVFFGQLDQPQKRSSAAALAAQQEQCIEAGPSETDRSPGRVTFP